MKGPNCDDEIEELLTKTNLSCHLLLDHAYVLPHSDDRRRLVVWQMRYSKTWTTEMERKRKIVCITSEENPRFRLLKKLQDSKQIRKEAKTIVCGKKIVSELLKTKYPGIEALVFPDDRTYFSSDSEGGDLRPLPEILIAAGCDSIEEQTAIWALEKKLFRDVDFLNTGAPLLLVNLKDIPEWEPATQNRGRTLLLPFGDPENIGAAIRSAVAFGVDRVVLLKEAANPFHPRSIRASAGGCFFISLLNGPSLRDIALPEENFYVLDKKGRNIGELSEIENFALLVGHEGGGIPDDLKCTRLTIPVSESTESLNASVSLGIALYMLCKK